MLFLVQSILFFALSQSAFAQTDQIKASCRKLTDNNAEYRNCIAHETGRLSAPLRQAGQERVCSKGRCAIRAVYDEATSSYRGGGLVITTEDNESGITYIIRDGANRITKFDQCGTCTWQDYLSGPLKDAVIKDDGVEALMITVKQSFLPEGTKR